MEKTIGLVPVSQTIFSLVGFVPVIVLLLTLPLIMAAMHPKKQEEIIELDLTNFVEDKKYIKFVSFASARTLQLYTYWSAGLINLFIPSGGGQWAVQGPIMIDAAIKLNASIGKVVMGGAWGDAWTNMIQPFWALPLLVVAKLNIRDIMGYCVTALLWAGIITSIILL